MRYEVSVEIDATTEVIWAALSDVESWPQWTPSMTRVERLDSGPFGLGSRVRIRQPRLPAVVWRVTEFTPGRSFTWQAHSVGVTTTAEHRLSAGPGTLVTATLDVEQGGPLAPLVTPFIARVTRRYVEMEAQGLKRRCERR